MFYKLYSVEGIKYFIVWWKDFVLRFDARENPIFMIIWNHSGQSGIHQQQKTEAIKTPP